MVVIGALACAALTALLVPSARLSHDQMLSSNTRSSSDAEIKFLRQFLQDAAHQQERKRLALESELTKLKRTSGDDIDQFDEKERAKHLRRTQAVPQLLSEALLAEEQIHRLSGNLSRGCDTAVVRQYIATELGLAERLEVFVPPSEWGRPSGFGGLVFESSRGVPILVCSKRAEGDDAMRRIGHGSDLWFQVRSGRGARVLLRTSMVRGMKGSRDCIACAAQLAAYFSDERSAEQVEVGYTDSRHVARTNAARAGRMRDRKRINSLWVRPADARGHVGAHAEGASFAYDQDETLYAGESDGMSTSYLARPTSAARHDHVAQSAAARHDHVAQSAARHDHVAKSAPKSSTPPRKKTSRGASAAKRKAKPTPPAPPATSAPPRQLRRGRATRRQRLEEAELESVRERLAEAGVDRRGGWRASKAKGNRRNRRYESRLLQHLDLDNLSEDD